MNHLIFPDYVTHYVVMFDARCPKRGSALRLILQSYCFQQQNSVFEGQLSPALFEELWFKINLIIEPCDSVIAYPISKRSVFNKRVLGKLHWKITRVF